MELGFVAELAPGPKLTGWVAGEPKAPAVDFRPTYIADIEGARRRHIRTYCCTGCGYLESYATTDVD